MAIPNHNSDTTPTPVALQVYHGDSAHEFVDGQPVTADHHVMRCPVQMINLVESVNDGNGCSVQRVCKTRLHYKDDPRSGLQRQHLNVSQQSAVRARVISHEDVDNQTCNSHP